MTLFELVAKITVDKSDFDKGLDDAEKTASGFGGKIQGAVGGVAKGLAVVGAAGTAAAAAVGKVAKSAVDGYAESEQLVGGIETLFGSTAPKVIAKANEAYKSAGLSANQYMNTTIQSAAAMISSLGGDQAKAAELMDLSITDMSDNVNKMGTSVEGVQNAYRGFSRGNFTMLDNLSLGYAGTKEGMQQLLTKAEELEAQQGRTTKYSIDSYADIVSAIHVVQSEMGITGTTAKEAEGTISGSLASMKTAWQNLINGLADPNADIGSLISNMVDSAKIALKNIIPAFKQAVKGVATLIKEVVPVIKEELPGIVNEVAPSLIESAAALIGAVVTALPTLITVIVDMLPQIMKTIGSAISQSWPQITQAVMDGLGTTGGKVIAGVLAAWATIKGLGIVGGISNAISIIVPLITSLANPIGLIVAAVAAAAAAIILNWDKIKAAWGKAVEFFGQVWEGIKGVFATVGSWISDIFSTAWSGVKKAWSGTTQFFGNVWNGIKGAFKNVGSWFGEKFSSARKAVTNAWSNIGKAFSNYKNSIQNAFSNIGDWFGNKFSNAKTSVINAWSNIGERFSHIREVILSVFKNAPDRFLSIGKSLMVGLYNGIVEKAQGVIDKIKGIASEMIGWAKNILGINSPSKVFDQIGQFVDLGMAGGIEGNLGKVQKAMNEMSDVVMDGVPEPELDLAIQNQRNRISSGFGMGGQMISVPRQETPRNLTVILELDRMQLARAVYQLNNQETQRVGMRLAGGYA